MKVAVEMKPRAASSPNMALTAGKNVLGTVCVCGCEPRHSPHTRILQILTYTADTSGTYTAGTGYPWKICTRSRSPSSLDERNERQRDTSEICDQGQ